MRVLYKTSVVNPTLCALCHRAKTRSEPASTSLSVDTWREREGASRSNDVMSREKCSVLTRADRGQIV